ncbi:MAG: putative signal transducing protein [Tenacibaculum sp.]
MNTYTKIFTGSAILVNKLSLLLREKDIRVIVKDNKESGRLAGFGTTGDAVELFVMDVDLNQAEIITQRFKEEIEK